MKDTVVVLGARGSVPVTSANQRKYGGDTVCVFLRLDGQPVLLDAGTGILQAGQVLLPEEREVPLLLSHAHADHLIGFPMWPKLFDSDFSVSVYGAERDGLDVQSQLHRLMSPPVWPVLPTQLPAGVSFHTIRGSFRLGSVSVEHMEGIHPGGVSLFRLRGKSKSVVCMTDCALEQMDLQQAEEFARGCDLLLCDGQYRDDELPDRREFGHSTWTAAARLGAACGAAQVRIIHHDPMRTDEALDTAGRYLQTIHPNCSFAYDKEEIFL